MDRAPENPDFPVICTKCLGSSYEEMEDAIEEALEEMDLETIDIFLLHEVRRIPTGTCAPEPGSAFRIIRQRA